MTEAEITAKAHELYKGKSAYSDRQRAKFIRLMTSMVAPLNQLRADNEAKIAANKAKITAARATIKSERAKIRRTTKRSQIICAGYAAQWRAKGEIPLVRTRAYRDLNAALHFLGTAMDSKKAVGWIEPNWRTNHTVHLLARTPEDMAVALLFAEHG